MEDTISTVEAVRVTGATYRQLDFWAKRGVIKLAKQAKGSGSRRRWSYDNCKLAARLAELSREGRGGISLERLAILATEGEMHLGRTVIRADFLATDLITMHMWDEVTYGRN